MNSRNKYRRVVSMPVSPPSATLLALLLVVSPFSASARHHVDKKRPSKPRATATAVDSVAPGTVARALASASPPFGERLKPGMSLAGAGRTDEALKAIALVASRTNEKALGELAAGGIAERAGRLTEALVYYQSAARESGTLVDYARYFEGALLQADGKRPQARVAFEAALRAGDLPPPTDLEIRTRLGDLAAGDRNWPQVSALFRPLLKKLKGTEYEPNALYQLFRAERRTKSGCKLARELYAKYPTFPATASWGPALRTDLVDGVPVGCPMSAKDVQLRMRRLQLAPIWVRTRR